MLQSQARQEAQIDGVQRSTKALWAKERERPCQQHGEAIARVEERVNALESDAGREVLEETVENAIIAAFRRHPRLAKGGLASIILGVLAWLFQSGLLDQAIGGP